MKWTDCAVQDLMKINGLRASVVSIQDRIEVLEMKFDGIQAVDTSAEPSGSSDRVWDDTMVDNIVERERLKILLEANRKMIEIIERGLNHLDELEKKILTHFYINRQRDHVEALKEELNIEKSQVYRLKNQALYKLTTHMYGLCDF